MADEAIRDDWASGAEGWVRNERLFDAVFAPFTAAVLGAADLGSARRVLDVGCGAGTLLDAAVAAGADAVGVDISPAMVEAACRRVHKWRSPPAIVICAQLRARPARRIAGSWRPAVAGLRAEPCAAGQGGDRLVNEP